MIKIYEIMAMEHGQPLFFLKHIERFKISLTEYKIFSIQELADISRDLIKNMVDVVDCMNIKITYNSDIQDFSIKNVISRKPSKEIYINGASVAIYNGEREKPLIKMENNLFREETESICEQGGHYDLLLMNTKGNITEGSRSNFLLIDKNDNIITSPQGSALNGITRGVIFDICKENRINIIEKDITLTTLQEAKSLLITGTSPEILPVKSCGDINFSVDNNIISILKNSFKDKKNKDRYLTEKIFFK